MVIDIIFLFNSGMDVLYEILPLPEHVIRVIATYDRILSVKSISKTDERYAILQSIPPKYIINHTSGIPNGWIIHFSYTESILMMCEPYKYSLHNIYIYINFSDFENRTYYIWS